MTEIGHFGLACMPTAQYRLDDIRFIRLGWKVLCLFQISISGGSTA